MTMLETFERELKQNPDLDFIMIPAKDLVALIEVVRAAELIPRLERSTAMIVALAKLEAVP